MPSWLYYSLTLVLYAACVTVSLFVEDISVVFDFVGSFGLSVISFLLPGVLYLLILRKADAKHQIESKKLRCWNIAGAIFVILLSLFNMGLVIMKSVME